MPETDKKPSNTREDTETLRRRTRVVALLRQRVAPGLIAQQLGLDTSIVQKDVRWIRRQWREERADLISEIGDSTLRQLDADESMLRAMMERARAESNFSALLQLQKQIQVIMKQRLDLAGLTTDEGRVNFAAPGSGDGETGLVIFAEEDESRVTTKTTTTSTIKDDSDEQ